MIEKNVGRLHVAVHEPLCVRCIECVRDLRGDRNGTSRIERAVAPEQRLEVDPVDVAHGDEEPPVFLAGLVDRDHVRVVETRRKTRLTQHAIAEALILGEAPEQQLQCDRPLELLVASAIHLAHPATAEQFLDGVSSHPLTGGNLRLDGQSEPLSRLDDPSSEIIAGRPLERC